LHKCLLFLFLCVTVVNTQELDNALCLTIDNDKFVMLDKYYTSGLFLTYKRIIDKDILKLKKEDRKVQYVFTLGNQIYTPENISSYFSNDFDMPYAGWFYANLKEQVFFKKQVHSVALDVGVTGGWSLSGKMQRWWHRLINVPEPTWSSQIENKGLINLKTEHNFNLFETNRNSLHYVVYTRWYF